jgi:hypothetical protein
MAFLRIRDLDKCPAAGSTLVIDYRHPEGSNGGVFFLPNIQKSNFGTSVFQTFGNKVVTGLTLEFEIDSVPGGMHNGLAMLGELPGLTPCDIKGTTEFLAVGFPVSGREVDLGRSTLRTGELSCLVCVFLYEDVGVSFLLV